MMRRRGMAVVLGLVLILTMVVGTSAQEDAPAGENTIQYNVVICETQAVGTFSGVMQPGFDIYYQIFSGPNGTGTALTGLRQVAVNGTYNTTDRVTYNGGTVPAGTTGSVYVTISREGSPNDSVFNEFADDVQDGCTGDAAPAPAPVTDPAAPTAPVDTPQQTTVDSESTVSIFLVICENQAIMNLSGIMEAGFDIYYQIFSGAGGAGQPLTTLRQVQVDADYAVSEQVTYNGGATIPAGSIGSAYVSISREGDPAASAYNEYVDDVQDGCAAPQNPLVSSIDAGDFDPNASDDRTFSRILSPFGGVINPGYVPPAVPLVVIGPREDIEIPRQETAGLIFAECNAYRVAEPGLLYDTDDIVIFWSWFARTPELVEEHIENVNYSVTYYQTVPLPNVTRSEIQRINGNYWVFYYSRLGNLRPGQYYIEYKVTWDEPISDGYEEFGPGTENDLIRTGCGFNIRPNPQGIDVNTNPWPLYYN